MSELFGGVTEATRSVMAKNTASRSYFKKILAGTSALVAVAGIGLIAGQAQADILTSLGSTGDLSSWTTYGTVAPHNSTVSLTLGTTPFTLTPATGHYMASIEPTGGAVSKTNIDSILGLTSGTFNSLVSGLSGGNQATNFGVLTQSQVLAAGNYTFYWSYAAQDYYPYNDGVMFSLAGNGVNELDILACNGPDGPPGTLVVGDYGATQWASSSFSIATAGTYQIGFASYNWKDTSVDPIFFVSDAGGTVTSPSSSSPIDTTSPYYLASNLGTTVTSDFQGGTLRVDAGGTIASDFSVGAYAGNTIDAYGNDATFSGTLSGTGGLTFTDSTADGHTITLTGTNTYNGATAIDSGVTLALTGTGSIANSAVGVDGTFDISGTTAGASIVSLSGSGSVLLGGQTLTLSAATGTFGGGIGGTGGLTVAGGSETLTGINTYSGATAIDSGATLYLTGTGSIADSVDPTVNGTFDISGTTGGTSVTSLSGSGTVVLGSQTLTLTNAFETFSGVIGGTGGLTVAGGSETLTGANTFTGVTTISAGTLQVGAAGTTGSIAGASIVDNGALVFNRTNSLTYAGVISGTGTLTQAGIGTLILNGVNTYTGLTTVAAGKLEVGDSSHTTAKVAGAVTIANGTTLLGYGTVGGAVSNTAGGTVAPGSSAGIGTLTVGSYTQGSTGTLAVEVSPITASLLNVNGAASLGGTLSATFDTGSYKPAILPVVRASSISGTFNTFLTAGTSSDFVYGIYYAPSDKEVDIVISPKSAGQVYGDVITSALDNADALNSVAFDHAAFEGCAPIGDSSADTANKCDRWTFWSRGLGGTAHTDAGDGAAAFNSQTWGVIGGVDYHLNEGASLHGALGYTSGKVNVTGANTKADTDAVFISFTGHQPGQVATLDAGAFYATGSADVTRDSGVGSTTASNSGNTASGFSFQVSHPLVGGDVVPFIRGTFSFLSYGPINETGGGALGLSGDHGRYTSNRYDFGLQLNHTYTTDDGIILRPQLLAALEDNGSSPLAPSVAMRLTDSLNTDFVATTPAPNRVAALIRLGLEAKLSQVWSVDAGFDGRYSGNQQQHLFYLDAAYHL